MKILHIIDSLGLGGAQTVVKGIFESQKVNKNIFLFVLRKREINIKISHPNVKIFDSKTKYSFKPLKELKALIEKEKIDVLHCHLFRSQFFGYILKNKYFPDIKLIFHEHGEIFQNHLTYNLFMKKSKEVADRIIAVSNATKKELIEKADIDPKKISVIYNFIDLKKFNQKNITWDVQREKEKLGIKRDEFVMGFVGRLSKEKGCDILINCLPHLDFKYKLLIAGDGPEKDNLIKQINKLKINENIIFLGYTENILKIYSLIDSLVIPSRHESFGIVALEAQAMGIPVIASDVPGLNELISNKYSSKIINMNKPNLLRNKLNSLSRKKYSNKKYSNKNLIKINKSIIKNYSLSKYLINLSSIYR